MLVSGVAISRAATPPTAAEKQDLEIQLQQLEDQIDAYEKTISQYKTQGASLKGEIGILDAKISKLNLQIKAVNLSIARLDSEIAVTADKINVTQADIDTNKKFLTRTLRNIYFNDKEDILEVLLKSPQLSDFITNVNNLDALQDNLRVQLQKLVDDRNELVEQKEQLNLAREDKAAQKAYQDSQKASIVSTKTAKNMLLQITKGKESEFKKYLAETQKKAAEVRSRIFEFLGGGELTFEAAYQFAKIASDATGVRPALLLAVLDRESALGRNVGQCDYKTAMHPTRDIPVFLALIGELGLRRDLDAGIIKVSCANRDGAYGGAMGPSQFIPSTWALYSSRVSQITGNNPASPWKNADAITATALYLKDAGAANASTAKEREAAARYYAGGRWRNYLWTYGARVIAKAEQFQQDIDILTSNN